MERSEQLNELAKSLADAQGELKMVEKDNVNPHFGKKYATLGAVIETFAPVISKHGLSVTQFIGHDDGADILTTWLLHTSGQYMAESMRLRPVKNDPQAQGSATTYARRYSYMAVLGLAPDEDDDGNAASQPRQQQRKSSGGNAKRSVGAAATNGTGNDDIEKRIDALAKEQQDVIRKRIADNNFPSPLPAGAVRAVERWIDEADQGRPFE